MISQTITSIIIIVALLSFIFGMIVGMKLMQPSQHSRGGRTAKPQGIMRPLEGSQPPQHDRGERS